MAFFSHMMSLAFLGCLIGVNEAQLNIQTKYGQVSGTTSGDIDHWYGIRYAAPAVGNLRWAEPNAPAAWSTFEATTHKDCLQMSDAGNFIGSEADCLTVDIWAPTDRPADTTLPVMVWIHGGSYTSATPNFESYNGTKLVQKSIDTGTPTIVVAITYRLAGLGFMAYEPLSAESPHHSSGNYGMLDQVFALQFIKTNINAFGGDNTKVTVFGESAGSYSICALLGSPLATGLFQGAIMESAYCALAWYTAEVAYVGGNTCAKRNNCFDTADPVKCLRALPANTAFDCTTATAANALGTTTKASLIAKNVYGEVLPNIDGYFLTASPVEAIQHDTTVPQVPVIVGSNHNEFMIFIIESYLAGKSLVPFDLDEQGLAALIEVTFQSLPYRVSNTMNTTFFDSKTTAFVEKMTPLYLGPEFVEYREKFENFASYMCYAVTGGACNVTTAAAGGFAFITDYLFTSSAVGIANAVAMSNRSAYRYLFTQPLTADALSGYNNTAYTPVGAFHSLDVPFVFGNFKQYLEGIKVGDFTVPDNDLQLSSDMMEYWLNFAATLNPNGNGLSNWVPLSQTPNGNGHYNELRNPGMGMEAGFHEAQMEMFQALATDTDVTVTVNQTNTTHIHNHNEHDNEKLSAGDDTAIIIGVLLALAIVFVVVLFVRYSKVKQQNEYAAVCVSTRGGESGTDV